MDRAWLAEDAPLCTGLSVEARGRQGAEGRGRLKDTLQQVPKLRGVRRRKGYEKASTARPVQVWVYGLQSISKRAGRPPWLPGQHGDDFVE